MADLSVKELSGSKFLMSFDRIKNASYSLNRVNLPGLTAGHATIPTPFTDFKLPGDKPVFDNFTFTFNCDEVLVNYLEIFEWMRKLYFPQSHAEHRELELDEFFPEEMSDAILEITTNQDRVNKTVQFHDCFPVSLGDLDMDSSQEGFQVVRVQCTIAYSYYEFI